MLNSITYFEEHCIKNFEKLEDDFFKTPKNFAEYVFGITQELCQFGLQMIEDSLETMDQMLNESPLRKKSWVVDRHDSKTITTSLGDLRFQRTLFQNKKTKERTYLLDHMLGLKSHQRFTEDALTQMLKEAGKTSYQRAAEHTSLSSQTSRQTVKNKIHALRFPKDVPSTKQKRVVERLYIEADEDHVSLQFRKKKGDLIQGENGRKNNGLLVKMVYVHEGKENETLHGKRKVLKNRHYFSGVSGEKDNAAFWDEIYAYLDQTYDLEQVKTIYLQADGGSWIKEGRKRWSNVTYVLDGFHLEKSLSKLVCARKKKQKEPILEELRSAIQKGTKQTFEELVEWQKTEMPSWRNLEKVDDEKEYLLSNWRAAKRRLKQEEGVLGSSTESHVSHLLSSRMSSRPMGWSITGASKMSKLRAYDKNGGDLLALVRYQKEEEEEIEEETMLSSAQIRHSERNRHGELGKYIESIQHTLSLQIKKKYTFRRIFGVVKVISKCKGEVCPKKERGCKKKKCGKV